MIVAPILLAAELVLPANNRIVRDYALREVIAADIAADAAWLQHATAGDLAAYQRQVRESVVKAMGGFPEKTALNAQVVGSIPRDGYIVEKVMFESRPMMHVTANVFVPDPKRYSGKRPAVLIPCGHSNNGKGSIAYQRGAVKAAKLGLIAMIFDPIDQGERRQTDPKLGKWSCAAHNRIGYRAELLGWGATQFRLWDGIRALDYLESRADVDASRLGVAGHSGGGTMTSWIMGFDDRVKTAAPSGYLTSIRDLAYTCGLQDAEQNVFGQLAYGFNHLGHIAVRAPSPVLLCSSHSDFFPITGTLETANAAERLYAALGMKENFRLSDTLCPHSWHESTSSYAMDFMAFNFLGVPLAKSMADYRSMQYGFDMNKVDTALGYGIEKLDELTTKQWDCSVTPTGSTLDLPGERTVYDVMRDVAEHQRAARAPLTLEAVRHVAGIREVSDIGFKVTLPNLVVMDDGVPVPVVHAGDKAKVFVVSDVPMPVEGAAVVTLRGFGETAGGTHKFYGCKDGDEEIARLYYVLGKNLVAKRAEDLIAAVRAFGDGPVKLIAEGRAAIPSAHAFYTARELFVSIELRNEPISWGELIHNDAAELRFADVVHGAWPYYDWTDLVK